VHYKACVTCNERKPLDAFSTVKRNPDGHTYSCKECLRLRQIAMRRRWGIRTRAERFRELCPPGRCKACRLNTAKLRHWKGAWYCFQCKQKLRLKERYEAMKQDTELLERWRARNREYARRARQNNPAMKMRETVHKAVNYAVKTGRL